MIRLLKHWLALLALLMTLPSLAMAQSADDKALMSFNLTMPLLNKYAAVHERLGAMVEANPSLAKKYENDESSDNESLADMVKSIEKTPEIVSALKSQGLTAREFVLTTIALLQAGMYLEAKKASPGTKPPANMNVANAAFMESKANQAELQKFDARMKVAQQKMSGKKKSKGGA